MRYRNVLKQVVVTIALLATGLLSLAAAPRRAEAALLYMAFQARGTIAGVTFDPIDILQYDTATDTASLFFKGSNHFLPGFARPIDAFEILPDGTFYLSTTENNTRLHGMTSGFARNDVVHYDPVAKVATVVIRGSEHFTVRIEDLDVIDALPDGSFLLSTRGPTRWDGLAVDADDIFRYDPVSHGTSLFFSGDSIFKIVGEPHVNIDAFDIMADGRYLLSVGREAETLTNGIAVNDADLVVYDPATGSAGIFLDHDDFPEWRGKHRDIWAVSSLPVIPEPMSLALFGMGVAGMGLRRRRRR